MYVTIYLKVSVSNDSVSCKLMNNQINHQNSTYHLFLAGSYQLIFGKPKEIFNCDFIKIKSLRTQTSANVSHRKRFELIITVTINEKN